MSSGLTFFIVTFIIGAVIVGMIGASLAHYVLMIVGVLIVLTIVRVLIGFQ